MATIREYLQFKLRRLKTNIDDEGLDFLATQTGVSMSDVFTVDNSKTTDAVLLAVIPEILALPDLSERDWSQKYDRGAIIQYCAILSKSLNLPNPFATDEGTIEDASHFW